MKMGCGTSNEAAAAESSEPAVASANENYGKTLGEDGMKKALLASLPDGPETRPKNWQMDVPLAEWAGITWVPLAECRKKFDELPEEKRTPEERAKLDALSEDGFLLVDFEKQRDLTSGNFLVEKLPDTIMGLNVPAPARVQVHYTGSLNLAGLPSHLRALYVSYQLFECPVDGDLGLGKMPCRNIDSISVYGCEKLRGELDLTNLPQTLQTLTLRQCAFTSIRNNDFTKLPPQLRRLDVSRNKLEGVLNSDMFSKLPPSLRELLIHSNNFTGVLHRHQNRMSKIYNFSFDISKLVPEPLAPVFAPVPECARMSEEETKKALIKAFRDDDDNSRTPDNWTMETPLSEWQGVFVGGQTVPRRGSEYGGSEGLDFDNLKVEEGGLWIVLFNDGLGGPIFRSEDLPTNLTHLNLHQYYEGTPNLSRLPPFMRKLYLTAKFDSINFEQLKNLPDTLTHLRLRYYDGNKNKKPPSKVDLSNLPPNLVELTLRGCYLEGEIIGGFSKLPNTLKVLSLERNPELRGEVNLMEHLPSHMELVDLSETKLTGKVANKQKLLNKLTAPVDPYDNWGELKISDTQIIVEEEGQQE